MVTLNTKICIALEVVETHHSGHCRVQIKFDPLQYDGSQSQVVISTRTNEHVMEIPEESREVLDEAKRITGKLATTQASLSSANDVKSFGYLFLPRMRMNDISAMVLIGSKSHMPNPMQ